MTTWTYDPKQTGRPVIDSKTGQRICDVDCVDYYEILDSDEDAAGYEAQSHSNGQLLAAAPDLLAALEEAKEYFSVDNPSHKGIRDRIYEAINKAKGE